MSNSCKILKSGYIIVPKRIVYDAKEYGDKIVTTLSCLISLSGKRESFETDIREIITWCNKKFNNGKYGSVTTFHNALESLKELEYIDYTCNKRTKPFDVKLNVDKLQRLYANEPYAVMYLDEINKITSIPKSILSSDSLLKTFVYLRCGIKTRKQNSKDELAECFNATFKSIGQDIGDTERSVSKYVKYLDKLHLIKCFRPYNIPTKVSFFTPDAIFVNYYKRFGNKEYIDKDYSVKEVLLKENEIRKYNHGYRINFEESEV